MMGSVLRGSLVLALIAAASGFGCKPSDPVELCEYNGRRLIQIVEDNADDCEALELKLRAYQADVEEDIKTAKERSREMIANMTLSERRAYARRFNNSFASMTRQVRMVLRDSARRCGFTFRAVKE